MGSFEKLGILVIVVIIVMILAVAIYQWGGTDGSVELGAALDGPTPAMSVMGNSRAPEIDFVDRNKGSSRRRDDPTAGRDGRGPAHDSWPGGIPKVYTIRSGDNVWNLVVKKWRLKEGFAGAIARANPRVSMKLLRPGQLLRIPNPDAYRSGRRAPEDRVSEGWSPSKRPPRGTRVVEVQVGDSFGSIAHEQLGRASRSGEIMELNPGVKPKSLRPGQKLLIPAR